MTDILVRTPERQNKLLHLAIERIEVAYLKSVRDGLENPAIFLLELADPTARAIVRTADREDETARHLERYRHEDVTPIALWHMPTTRMTWTSNSTVASRVSETEK